MVYTTKYENDGFIFKLEYRGGGFRSNLGQGQKTQPVFEPIEGGSFEGGFGESHRVISGFSSSSIQLTGLDSM